MHQSERWKWSRSVVSDSSRPHGLKPTRLLRPWDFPGKSTGVGCHFLLQRKAGGWKHRPPKRLTKPPPSKICCCAEKLPLWDLQIIKAPYKREVARILKLGSLSFQTTSLRGNLKCFALSCFLKRYKNNVTAFSWKLRVVKNLHQCCWSSLSSPHHFRLRCRGQ